MWLKCHVFTPLYLFQFNLGTEGLKNVTNTTLKKIFSFGEIEEIQDYFKLYDKTFPPPSVRAFKFIIITFIKLIWILAE